MGQPDWQGIFAILVTPLTEDDRVDEKGVRHLVDFACDQGLQGVVVLGSNGEFPYLSDEEKLRVMAAAADQARGRLPVLAGASAFGTDQAIAYARAAKAAGCDGVMAALPLYFAVTLSQVKAHVQALAQEGGLPVFFYYFPETTGLKLEPEELAEIAAIPGVPGAKLTLTNRSFLKKTIAATRPQNWAVFAGTSFLLADTLEFGGAGVFCPLPLIGPQELRGIHQAFSRGDRGQARALQDKVLRAIPIMTGMSLPPAALAAGFKLLSSRRYKGPPARTKPGHHLVKEALRLQGHPITNRVRRPFAPVTPKESELVKKTLADLGWL